MSLFVLVMAVVVLGGGMCALLLSLAFGKPARAAEFDRGYKVKERQPSTRAAGVLLGLLMLGLGGSLVLLDSCTTVAARGVAVQTAFGKVRGNVLGPGFHWVKPWYEIEEFDASVQTLKFYKDERDDDGSCITVRLGNNTQACTDVTAQWNINHKGDVKSLYLNYKTFANIHDNLVKRQLQSALNEVFGSYDPLAAISSDKATAQVNTVDLQAKVKSVLQRDLGTAIYIDSVTIPIVHFDGDTENRLKAFQQSKADTRIAEQNTQTAHQQAIANHELANQADVTNPGVMYQNCLNLVDRLAQKNQLSNLPPTFNCGGAGNGVLLQTK